LDSGLARVFSATPPGAERKRPPPGALCRTTPALQYAGAVSAAPPSAFSQLASLAPLIALAALGCEGSGPRADAGHAADAAATADADPGSRPPASGASLPAGVRPARRILDATATITGGGEGSCTHAYPNAGDRWCVFRRPGNKGDELWVMNVTRAAGTVPACDGSDPACLRLTTNVWTGGGLNGPIQPYANRFFGDTLIFYADSRSAETEVHRGPAFAWRPGWAAARRISSDTALECWSHPRAPVAHCVEDLAGDPVAPDNFELRAGAIGDRDGITLASLGRVSPRDAEGRLAWEAGFSPGGEAFVLSSPDPSGTLSLRAIATDQLGAGAPAEVLRDARQWQVSHDGRRIFFLREENATARALYVADFPSGGNLTKLAPDIAEYFVLGTAGEDRGVGIIAADGPEAGTFRLIDKGGAASTIFTYGNGLDGVRLSPDLRYTAWRDQDFRVQIVANDKISACELNANGKRAAYSISFLGNAGLVFWTESDGGDRDRRDGYFADPAGCLGKQRFARAVYFLIPVADRGLVFADEVDDDTQRPTLKYAAVRDGRRLAPEGPVRIHDEIDGTSVLVVGGDPWLVLFTVSVGDPERQGTYLFGPLPF
jgi:hypothetical protein